MCTKYSSGQFHGMRWTKIPSATTSARRSPGTDSPESHGFKQPSALNGGYVRVQHMAIVLSRFDNPQFDSREWSTIPIFYVQPSYAENARFCRISVVILVVAPIVDHGGACHRREPQPGRT